MTADDRRPRLGADLRGAAEDLAEHGEGQPIVGEEGQVEDKARGPAHRVDVRERVAGGDRPEGGRVVDDRRDHVGGQDEAAGPVVGEAHDGGVVGQRVTDPDPVIGEMSPMRRRGQPFEDLDQVTVPELGGSTTSPRVLGEANGLCRWRARVVRGVGHRGGA